MDIEKLKKTLIENPPDQSKLWNGDYKIPWDQPEFSKRMMKEHLSQEHDLASRKFEMITRQTKWIFDNISQKRPGKLLDIGCGPGFYINNFASHGYKCRGIDFSPASIEYANNKFGHEADFVCSDLRTANFGSDFDLITWIYGEFNVFPKTDLSVILRKANEALNKSSKLLIELHTYDAVKQIGETDNSWFESESGLFSESPYLCFIDNRWYENAATSLQRFFIVDKKTKQITTYHNTIKAWTMDEMKKLLSDAGFGDCNIHPDWPVNTIDLFCLTVENSS